MESTKTIWAARIAGGLAVLFLIFDGVIKVINIQAVADASARLGLPEHLALGIGSLELLLVAVYLVPRTAILGAVLWTGYLGGATAIQVRAGQSWFGVLFPIFIALLLWGAIYLRDRQLRALLPLRQR